MESSYWRGVLRAAVARRRLLAAAGAGTLVPALLAACGGGSATTERKDKSGLLTEASCIVVRATESRTFSSRRRARSLQGKRLAPVTESPLAKSVTS